MSALTTNPSELGITGKQALPGFCIKEFSQPPFRRLPWHEHQDASICFVAAGSYTERFGGHDRECTPHSMVFKPASARHSDHFGRLGGKCLLIEISPRRLDTLRPFSGIMAQPSLQESGKLAALGHRIYREFRGGDVYSPLVMEGLILEALAEASRAGVEEPAGCPPRWLRQARDLIHDGYREPLTLSSIARTVGVHPSHLARTFRKRYHRSIGEYVRCLRLERAAAELAGGSVPLGMISAHSGFFDQSHFSRAFKAHTGLTPARFRAASRQCTAGTKAHRAS